MNYSMTTTDEILEKIEKFVWNKIADRIDDLGEVIIYPDILLKTEKDIMFVKGHRIMRADVDISWIETIKKEIYIDDLLEKALDLLRLFINTILTRENFEDIRQTILDSDLRRVITVRKPTGRTSPPSPEKAIPIIKDYLRSL